MFCSKCGTQNPDTATYCSKCGTVLQPLPEAPHWTAPQPDRTVPYQTAATSGKAVASLVLGIMSFALSVVAGLPAVILGIMAKKDIRQSRGTLGGDGLALAGIILGIVGSVFMLFPAAIAIPSFLEAQTRSKVSRAMSDMRSLATAVEAYCVDYNVYPPALTPHVTTPVAYITSIPRDPFDPAQSEMIRYWAPPKESGQGWILYSAGPDQVYDVNPAVDYDPRAQDPPEALLLKQFDPTNGTKSRGDIIRTQRGMR